MMSSENGSGVTVDDLASNDEFITHCLHPTAESIAYWADWLKKHPQHGDTIKKAKYMVLGMHLNAEDPDLSTLKIDIWDHLSTHVKESEASRNQSVLQLNWKVLAGVAASVLLLFTAYQFSLDHKEIDNQWFVNVNTSDTVKSILLSDNSRIDLSPGSTVKYASNFSQKIRAIALDGEAFFEVERDTARPFRVFTHETITEVLGTSFSIKTDDNSENVEISVVTGKVAVYSHTDKRGGSTQSLPMMVDKANVKIVKPNTKIYLTPNERAIYNSAERNLRKSIVDVPRILDGKDQAHPDKFTNAPVSTVFSTLESVYGIEIRYDQEALSTCSISTSLGDAPLFTKLEMICTALDLQFVEKDAIIYVNGAGCK